MKLKLSLLVDTVKRFPTAILLAVANTALVWWAIDAAKATEQRPVACLMASGVGIVLSVLAGLVAERGRAGGVALPTTNCQLPTIPYPLPTTSYQLLLQATALATAGGFAWWFTRYDITEPHFLWSYFLTLGALAALTAVALGWRQTAERVFPCAAFAGVLGGTAAVAVGGGFSLVLVAVEKLFGAHVLGDAYGTLWGSAWATVGLLFFLAYVTRREPFEYPKVWRVLLVYVTLPIYLVLLAVMWAYLGKCVVTWSLPNGQVNWLVTLAASLWMGLFLVLGGLDAGFVRLFRRFGALLVVPLIALQIVALRIRIGEYGLTPSRYASVLFVVFALVFAALSLVRSRWATPAAYGFFAALAVFAAHSRWNVIDTGVRCQLARLEAFRARKAAGETFDKTARHAIMGAWEFTEDYTLTNGVYRYSRDRREYNSCWEDRKARFREDWGFEYVREYERRNPDSVASEYKSRNFYPPCGSEIDLSGYSSCVMARIQQQGEQVKLKGSEADEGKDITGAFLEAAGKMTKDGMLAFDVPDVGHVVFVGGYLQTRQKEGEKEPKVQSAYGQCLILRK